MLAVFGFYRCLLKPWLERLVAAVLLSVLAPVFVVLAAAVRIAMPGPALFTQTRTGKSGRCFQLIKFRTMTDARDVDGRLLPDSNRITPFGQWLRSTSLDELPELWNVLRGDMSLVGPRPLLPEYLPLYTKSEQRRHEVLPGITGWAQVNGRNELSWERKFELDAWYVDHSSFIVDLKIILLTIGRVLDRRGVTQPGSATAEPLTACRKGIVVLGAGGHASVVIATLQAAGINVAAAYDDDSTKHGQMLLGIPIRGSLSDVEPSEKRAAVVALGDSGLRRDVAAFYPFDWRTVVHPAATVHDTVSLGAGTVVFANAIVQPNCRIGKHAIINTSASIDHDCSIGDFAHVAPGAVLAGGVTVGAHSLVGVGSCVAPGVTIGRHTMVGAGATVVRDLPDDVVAIGCPARIVRSHISHTSAA